MSDEKPLCKDVFGNNIFMAEADAIKSQQENVNRLLLLIGEYMGWDGDISHVFVSDLTTLGDFCLEDEELSELAEKLGFAVEPQEYLHDIALRMKPAA